MPTYSELQNSTFLDYDSYRSPAAAPSGGTAYTGNFTFNVALVLPPATNPATLLSENWATRQSQIAAMTANNTLWTAYGANGADYTAAVTALQGLGSGITVFPTDGATTNQYVASQQSATIWVQVNQSNFTTLFGSNAALMENADGIIYWNGNLSLPSDLIAAGVQGIEFDTSMFATGGPANGGLPATGGGVSTTLLPGPQSIGNSSTDDGDAAFPNPNTVAEHNYNVPLTGALWDPSSPKAVDTAPIGVLEPPNGTALNNGADFQARLNAYLVNDIGLTNPNVVVTAVANGGQQPTDGNGERSLDVSILSAIDPNSDLYVYAGSGIDNNAGADAYTAYQSAVWDPNDPQVVSSSYGLNAEQPTANSAFLFADQMLFMQAALQNMTMVTADSDGGSGDQFGNGETNVETGQTSPYDLMVGGTSLSTLAIARKDPTLAPIVALALGNDPATLWQLVSGGLTALPSDLKSTSQLIETVWNEYDVNAAGNAFVVVPDDDEYDDYLNNNASTGGVDTTQPTPSYQTAFGLVPTTQDSAQLTGRGAPDVAALAGGNMFWDTLDGSMTGTTGEGGTSAATPLWAALITQINAILDDQKGVPLTAAPLGYMNDLLYIADVIAPGSFNDITMGNNISSFTPGGPITDQYTKDDSYQITPTGYGYNAGPGYDLTTGLGSPNGLLLARAISAITTTQTNALNNSTNPDMLDPNAAGGWTSNGDQSLLFQTMSSAAVNVSLFTGAKSQSYSSGASSPYAWTSQFADQVLQPDFDSGLVTMFDKQSQGVVTQALVSSGDNVAVTVNGATTYAVQGTLSTAYGFADFDSSTGATSVRVANPVMTAVTVNNASGQDAVVRLRSNGQDSLSIEFYQVDDMKGRINGVAPGQANYAAQVATRLYDTLAGGSVINGPTYGNYGQAELTGIGGGDLIAMVLTNNSHGNTYYEFAQANESVGGQSIAHVWNYGSNTIGWEDTYGGGDHDFNDLVVGVDFTSAAGNGLLVGKA